MLKVTVVKSAKNSYTIRFNRSESLRVKIPAQIYKKLKFVFVPTKMVMDASLLLPNFWGNSTDQLVVEYHNSTDQFVAEYHNSTQLKANHVIPERHVSIFE